MTTKKQLLLKRQHGQYKTILVFGMPDWTQLSTEMLEWGEGEEGKDDEYVEGEWYTILFQKVISS